MKKLTLNQVNLTVIDGNLRPNSGCDFCGDIETFTQKLIVASQEFKYRDENKNDRTDNAVICFNCVRQLNKLIDDDRNTKRI